MYISDFEDEVYEFLEPEPIHDPIDTGKGEHGKGIQRFAMHSLFQKTHSNQKNEHI